MHELKKKMHSYLVAVHMGTSFYLLHHWEATYSPICDCLHIAAAMGTYQVEKLVHRLDPINFSTEEM